MVGVSFQVSHSMSAVEFSTLGAVWFSCSNTFCSFSKNLSNPSAFANQTNLTTNEQNNLLSPLNHEQSTRANRSNSSSNSHQVNSRRVQLAAFAMARQLIVRKLARHRRARQAIRAARAASMRCQMCPTTCQCMWPRCTSTTTGLSASDRRVCSRSSPTRRNCKFSTSVLVYL